VRVWLELVASPEVREVVPFHETLPDSVEELPGVVTARIVEVLPKPAPLSLVVSPL
jgi:hypothetical protein